MLVFHITGPLNLFKRSHSNGSFSLISVMEKLSSRSLIQVGSTARIVAVAHRVSLTLLELFDLQFPLLGFKCCSNLHVVFERQKAALTDHRIVHVLHICINSDGVSHCSPHTVLYAIVAQWEYMDINGFRVQFWQWSRL